ncbi:Sds3-like-domain-containing protein [Apodospora peruviana]|uniref:Sds3-like-domain-containing protein n=1 Tax=Apodospora peruviana TaxID=516989 RepID=A0AAE0IPW2_9PEZI|nr:Sds3-like-domain-containing protein [Apodospora peruviana]
MATGDTAPPLALSSSPPPLLDHSPSNLSSPLSDVEDKDGSPEEMDLDVHMRGSGRHGTPKRNEDADDAVSDPDSESDDESKLSEVDVNDSEAETERLYDSPRKSDGVRDILNAASEVRNRQFVDRRDRAFERSPSKLQQQIQADLDAENAASNDNSLSDADEVEDDDASLASSEPEPDPESATDKRSQPPSQGKKAQTTTSSNESTTSKLMRQDSTESRKRKRASMAEQSGSEQPLRKRTGSIGAPVAGFSGDDVAMIDEEGTSTNPQSGIPSPEETNNEEEAELSKKAKKPIASVERDTVEPSRIEKGRRNTSKRQKTKSPQEPEGQIKEDGHDESPEDADSAAAEEAAPHADDEHTEDPDETEILHKNEEELERKKAAWEELGAIEKQFTNFRERLYQERLDQLNQEEAMLTAENPTHPEYLAMLQCVNERRDERVRLSTLERDFNMAMLRNRAVAERAQIMSQFYQAVRESREKVLEELGKEWYDIQQERRRFANAIPDYGIRFPRERIESIRHAVAYNKEVSILSGFAKHVGFPAAPPIHGVSEDQLENDLELILRARESVREPAPPPRQITSHPPVFTQDFTASVPFGRVLGPAGEQFIEQTPWANPNHPSHHIQRQQSHHELTPIAAGPSSSSTASGNRRHSHQPGGLFSSSTTTIVLNGDSPVQQIAKAHPESTLKGAKLGGGPGQAMKRETVAQVS